MQHSAHQESKKAATRLQTCCRKARAFFYCFYVLFLYSSSRGRGTCVALEPRFVRFGACCCCYCCLFAACLFLLLLLLLLCCCCCCCFFAAACLLLLLLLLLRLLVCLSACLLLLLLVLHHSRDLSVYGLWVNIGVNCSSRRQEISKVSAKFERCYFTLCK